MYWSVLLKLVHVESSPINRQNFASRAQDLPVQQRILALTPGLGAGLDRVTGWNQSRNWRFSCGANFHAWPQARLWCGEWCPAGYQPYHWVFELIEAAAPGTGIWTLLACSTLQFFFIHEYFSAHEILFETLRGSYLCLCASWKLHMHSFVHVNLSCAGTQRSVDDRNPPSKQSWCMALSQPYHSSTVVGMPSHLMVGCSAGLITCAV